MSRWWTAFLRFLKYDVGRSDLAAAPPYPGDDAPFWRRLLWGLAQR